MNYAAFDTQEFVETLEKSGFSTEQARAVSSAVRKANDKSDVATKSDIQMVKRDIDDLQKEMMIVATRQDIKDVRSEIEDVRSEIEDVRKDMRIGFEKVDAKIEKLSMQLTIRLGLMMVVAIGALATIIKL